MVRKAQNIDLYKYLWTSRDPRSRLWDHCHKFITRYKIKFLSIKNQIHKVAYEFNIVDRKLFYKPESAVVSTVAAAFAEAGQTPCCPPPCSHWRSCGDVWCDPRLTRWSVWTRAGAPRRFSQSSRCSRYSIIGETKELFHIVQKNDIFLEITQRIF